MLVAKGILIHLCGAIMSLQLAASAPAARRDPGHHARPSPPGVTDVAHLAVRTTERDAGSPASLREASLMQHLPSMTAYPWELAASAVTAGTAFLARHKLRRYLAAQHEKRILEQWPDNKIKRTCVVYKEFHWAKIAPNELMALDLEDVTFDEKIADFLRLVDNRFETGADESKTNALCSDRKHAIRAIVQRRAGLRTQLLLQRQQQQARQSLGPAPGAADGADAAAGTQRPKRGLDEQGRESGGGSERRMAGAPDSGANASMWAQQVWHSAAGALAPGAQVGGRGRVGGGILRLLPAGVARAGF